MKRTKQVQKMVDRMNEFLKNNHITDDKQWDFTMFIDLLIQADAYSGYNLVYDDCTLDNGIRIQKLASTSDRRNPELKNCYLYLY